MALLTSDFVVTQTWQEVGAGSTRLIVIEALSPRDHFQFSYGSSAPTNDRAGHACRGIDPVRCVSENGDRIWVRVFGTNPDLTVRVSAE